MVDIRSPTAEIRQGKKDRKKERKIEITGQKHNDDDDDDDEWICRALHK